ncbi:response regulator [Bacillus massiliigorillae]|uniref:response regulator n=1 Tax=Bacillus massiliigorillae TaxID=1243664 RepID=UPI00039C6B86|nr:response regulator [Bacillus massiliigorillae]
MHKWKIIIVEDEMLILKFLTRLFSQHPNFEVIATFSLPEKALVEIPLLQADALLFDIEMPRTTGLELAEKLVSSGMDVPIFFSTAHPQYALEAFHVQALHYILKPMTVSKIQQIDERLQKYYGVKRELENETEPIIQVKLFGEPMVRINDQVVVKWPTKVTEELFYYFLLHDNQICSKWRIIDELWPNMDEKRGSANLYNTIYRIRQLFSEKNAPVQINRLNDGYMFVTNSALDCDYHSWVKEINQISKGKVQITKSIVGELCDKHWGELLETKGYLWALPFQQRVYEMKNRMQATL